MDGDPGAPRDSANLIEQYRLLHSEAAHEDPPLRRYHFPGRSMMPFLGEIKLLILTYGTQTVLDYGCGQGWCYDRIRVQDWWRVKLTLYDPAVPRYAAPPQGTFGGVICCDVLEHLAEQDVDHYLGELERLTGPGGWCLMSVCCRLAARKLPDGRNTHVTIKPEAWWLDRVKAAFPKSKHFVLRFTP